MDVNCSGYSGPWPGAAAHFFCPVPGSTGNNPNNCTPVPMTGRKKNPAEAGQLEKLFWLIPNAASCDSEESHPESQDCNHTRMNIERWRIMRLDCRQHDYPEKAHPRHKVTKSTHHHVPLLHIRVHPIVGNPHDCRQDTMLDNVLPFYLQRLLAQGRGAARMSGRRSSLPSPCIYTVSNHCTYVNKKKNYFDTFFPS